VSEPDRPEPDPDARSNPFDNPFFLPVLLFGLGAWFAYDGWLNPGIKAVTFNRWGAVLLLAAATVTGRRAWRERRASRDRRSSGAD
jgi:uncharacterized membrane protein